MTNAILMASGLGVRMHPLTEKTPKPLIKVGNKPMIESIIDAFEKRGIDNIYVVVGYLAEQFNYLTKKYDNLSLIHNHDFKTVNNISSIYYAKEYLEKADCYICESDLYLSDPSILKQELKESCYYGKMVKGYSDDWLFDLDEYGFIKRVGKKGTDKYNMVGISYFTQKDAKTLSKVIGEAYGQNGYETLFWDDVVNQNLDKLKLKIYPVYDKQIIEIDTVEELNKVNQEVKNGSR
ncbi:MAG: phosphocholine cytidylyltransferase family protein [Candidatus Riflebacteria bacterium]|nr:phosphocholine cytidylyltransferase family protein [Candidatus Riflebacteria bacterium]